MIFIYNLFFSIRGSFFQNVFNLNLRCPHESRNMISQHGQAALICASLTGRADCVRLLLDAGADKEAKGHVRV